jgi:hypothetical protein
MQYCSNCGTRLNEEAKFCPTCGTGVANFINATGAEPKGGIAEPAAPSEEHINETLESGAVSEPAETAQAGQALKSEEADNISVETPQDGKAYEAPAAQQSGVYQPTSAPAESSYYQSAAPQGGSSYYQQTPAQGGNSYYQQTPAQGGNSYYQQTPAQGGNPYYQQTPAQNGSTYNQGGGTPNYQGAAYGGAPNYQKPRSSGSGSVVAGVLFCIFLPLVGLIYTLIKKPFQKTGQIIAVIWCIVAMVLSILFSVIYYNAVYNVYDDFYEEDEISTNEEAVIVSISPNDSNTYGDIPVQLSIFDSYTADNIVKAFGDIGLDVADISGLVYDTDWESGPVYTFEYAGAAVDLYLYDDGKVYSIETDGTQVYLEGYEPWQIDDYIGSSSNTSSVPASSASTGVIPENGYIFYEIGYDRVCPLTVVTQGDYGYYIKLVNAYDETEILTFFVQPGQTVDIDVPLGDYYIRYASGLTWYDEVDLFGPDTAYSEAGDIFYFTEDEENYYGYTVELYMQEGGNLDTYDIAPGDF